MSPIIMPHHVRSVRTAGFAAVRAFIFCALGALTAMAPAAARAAHVPRQSAQDPATSSDAVIARLADKAFEHMLQEYPSIKAQLGIAVEDIPDITLESHLREVENAKRFLAELQAVSVDELGEDGKITYGLLRYKYTMTADAAPYYWLDFAIVPYKASRTFDFLNQLIAGQSLAEAKGRAAYLHLIRKYRDLLRQHRDKLKQQDEMGLRLPKSAVTSVQKMLIALRAELPKTLSVSNERLAGVPKEAAETFAKQATYVSEHELLPALDELIGLFDDEYLARVPQDVGLAGYPHGKEYYKYLVRFYTSLDLDPVALHETSLRRVRELQAQMKAKAREAGFAGTLEEAMKAIQKNPRYMDATPAKLEARYKRYIAEIEPEIPAYFSRTPRAPYGVARLSLTAENGLTYGYYEQPSQLRPQGTYYYNAADPSRSQIGARTLIYHELVPGHHFQIALQTENRHLDSFRRNFGVGAYIEGWAEYAASLGIEMGLYSDPIEYIGRLMQELFSENRIVVDTGLGYLGWSLDEARRFMLENSFRSEAEISTETVRYATFPGQVLAAGVGYRQMWKLRRMAQDSLQQKFDIREFHETLIGAGSMPLDTLESRVARYIARARLTQR